jgi:nucleoside-diphosphate-sugar epimerase
MKLTNNKRLININPERKRPKLSEVENLLCNNKKIKKITNWKPKTNLKKGLKKTLEWFKKNKTYHYNQYII